MEKNLNTLPKRLKDLLFRAPFLLILCFSIIHTAQAQSTEDFEIVANLEDEFIRREEIDSRLFDIQSLNGIVTLSGTVDNILAKEKAIELAGSMSGVRGIINIIEVEPPEIPDETLTEEINKKLRENYVLGRQEVFAEVFGGIVELSGTVGSATESQRAEVVAKGVMGVTGSFNSIQVEYQEQRSDIQIANDIRFALQQDVVIDHTRINISVDQGKVVLSGPVVSLNNIPKIERLSRVYGVNSIDVSGLRLDPLFPNRGIETEGLQVTDEMIFLAIRDVFLLDPRLSYFTPDLAIENQVVFLGGTVPTLSMKMLAEETASNVPGVVVVNNFIEVNPDELRTDAAIIETIMTAFALDPFLAGYDIIVNVIEGRVHLTGAIDNYFQKAHATEIAMQITGVQEVVNNMVVTKTTARRGRAVDPLDAYYEPGPIKEDFELYNDIKDKLYWRQDLDVTDVTVEVTDGHVVLRGIVNTWEQSMSIEQICIDVGALMVINKIEVRQGYQPEY